MVMEVTFAGGNVYFGDYGDYDFYEDYEEPSQPQNNLQQISYHNPKDNIPTLQESQIRQEELRIEGANENMIYAGAETAGAVSGTGIAVASGQPYATVVAGGSIMMTTGKGISAYQQKEEAQARYDKKVQEEKEYLEQIKEKK